MRRALPLFALLLMTVPVATGCARKKPATAPSPPTTESVPAPAPAEQPVVEVAAAPEDDPLAGDLEAVNAYVQANGLLRDVFYDFDSAELSFAQREILVANARFLTEHPEFEIDVEGHCDERGTGEYNLALGERRASVARQYLVSLGVDPSRLRTISLGEERPDCVESNEQCWSRNRRSHFVVAFRRGAT